MAAVAPRSDFRRFIPPPDSERSKQLASLDTYEWTKRRCAEPFTIGWMKSWEERVSQPYKGVTVDGSPIPSLYPLKGEAVDEAPGKAMASAARHLLAVASPSEQKLLAKSIDAVEWRYWGNPEMYIFHHGIRLEEVSDAVVDAVYDLMRASLSIRGYAKARGCMKINHFLGEMVNGRKVLNERSYNFLLFGEPSESAPWGWQVYGHHFCMNCLVVGGQMVITPIFMGAEPNIIDEGPDKGLALFTDQEQNGMRLMSSMDASLIEKVRIFKKLKGDEYPADRWHRADQRTLGGAFQDNRIIPYEGALVTTFSQDQQDMVRALAELSLNYLPDKVLVAKMADIDAHWDDTHFAWIGEWGPEDAFYYKIHSPVIMIEFDHHSGVFLNNKDALPFHIHTIVRTPNGNDYGHALVKQYYEKNPR